MAFSVEDPSEDVMGEINMTPLVDVMLVLLIIFIITVPVMKHAVQIELPRASSQPQQAPPPTQHLALDAQGAYQWNGQAVAPAMLGTLLAEASAREPQPELHIHADKAVRYEYVAQAMASAQRAGLRRIGFVTEPSGPGL